eukprot:TRINITY_DN7344_c0_g1_i13.p1 TRINITY_DN7344_c0_g1~~TRINITY_DN7344_c0_g1_i13.p1  ORF type:complete len:323 (-),score=12.76 TRINITY_DN7344_c0_g1_i13:185-1153(-)
MLTLVPSGAAITDRTWKCMKAAQVGEEPGEMEYRGAPPEPRRWGAIFYYEPTSEMIVWGGHNGSVNYNDMHAFSLRTREWRRVRQQGDIPSARHACGFTVVRNLFYLHGGYTSRPSSSVTHNDMFVMDMREYRWYEIQQADADRWDVKRRNGHRMLHVPGSDHLFCFGGHTGLSNKWLNEVLAFSTPVRWQKDDIPLMPEGERNRVWALLTCACCPDSSLHPMPLEMIHEIIDFMLILYPKLANARWERVPLEYFESDAAATGTDSPPLPACTTHTVEGWDEHIWILGGYDGKNDIGTTRFISFEDWRRVVPLRALLCGPAQ